MKFFLHIIYKRYKLFINYKFEENRISTSKTTVYGLGHLTKYNNDHSILKIFLAFVECCNKI